MCLSNVRMSVRVCACVWWQFVRLRDQVNITIRTLTNKHHPLVFVYIPLRPATRCFLFRLKNLMNTQDELRCKFIHVFKRTKAENNFLKIIFLWLFNYDELSNDVINNMGKSFKQFFFF